MPSTLYRWRPSLLPPEGTGLLRRSPAAQTSSLMVGEPAHGLDLAVVKPVEPPPGYGRQVQAEGGGDVLVGPPEPFPRDTQFSEAGTVRGARGMVTVLPPLRTIVRVRCFRSTPSASMSLPIASDTRRPLSASNEISA
jgi:hypothetical protein